MRTGGDTLGRWVVAVLVFLAVALSLHSIFFSPAGIVILQDARAPWISSSTPVTGTVQQWGRREVQTTRFLKIFSIPAPPAEARLELRCYGDFFLFLNDVPVTLPEDRSANWKIPTVIDVARYLRSGDNWIMVKVQNARGPALLSLRLEGNGISLASGPEWQTRIGGAKVIPAMIATDVRPLPLAEDGERVSDVVGEKAGVLVLLFVISSGAFLLLRRVIDLGRFQRLPLICFGGIAVAWLVLYAAKFLSMDISIGLDSPQHLLYVDFLRQWRRLPLATDGWSMSHPPLFYLLAASLEELASALALAIDRGALLKPISFLGGLGTVWVVLAVCRRLFPGDLRSTLCAIIFAGFLPMNLYMAAYFSNEALHAFLFGAGLLVLIDLLLDEQVSLRKTLLLSVILGLALLTKVSALLLAAVAGVVVPFKIWVRHRERAGAVLARLAALALPMLLLSGWYYLRNVLAFGRPVLVGSWIPGSEPISWWSHPGFHTPAYYLSFGASLIQPFLSAFLSFWDALYSSAWGDGFLASAAGVRYRHSHWNYEFMAAAYPLAVPATLLLLIGWGRAGWMALRDPDAGRRAVFATLSVLGGAFLFLTFYITLHSPFYGQAKASFSLGILPALAVFFALGFSQLDRWMARRRWVLPRTLLFGWFGTFVAVCYLSFLA